MRVCVCVSHPPTEFSAGLARWPKEQRVMHASHSFIQHSLAHSFSGRARTTLILMHDKNIRVYCEQRERNKWTPCRRSPAGSLERASCPYLGCGLILVAAPAADVIRARLQFSHIPQFKTEFAPQTKKRLCHNMYTPEIELLKTFGCCVNGWVIHFEWKLFPRKISW